MSSSRILPALETEENKFRLLFSAGKQQRNAVKCTVADDNGWVTGFSVFIQQEKWVKNKCPEHFLDILFATTLYFWDSY